MSALRPANHVRLRRGDSPGCYEARVRVIGTGFDPFIITVQGQFRDWPAMRCWVVESDDERMFFTLTEARAYIDRFFEEAAQ